MGFLGKGLGRRIVTLMILASAALSVVAAAVQLWSEYQRDLGNVLTEFSIVQDSFLSSLENSLWQFNFSQVEILLDGIFAQADVVALRLNAQTGQTWERGEITNAASLTRDFVLRHNGAAENLGNLSVTLTLEHIRERLIQHFMTVLASNFIKTLAASVLMLLIFDKMVSRHLRSLASETRGGVWETGERRFDLDRSKAGEGDELDQIVSALNDAGERITEAMEAEQLRGRELQLANDKLQKANREQAEFTFAISHDLKSPSNTIGMLIDELNELNPNDQEVSDVLDDMSRTNRRMRALVDDILDYSQTIAPKSMSDLVDLNKLVTAVAEDLTADIIASGAEIRCHKLPKMRGNATQLRVLFQNLISNAIKFRDPSRPPVVEVIGPASDVGQTIRIADNGIGIPEEYRERVFGLFQRLHTHSEFEGTGLGLTVCRRIMFNHGGKICARPNERFGTVFELNFARGGAFDQTGGADR